MRKFWIPAILVLCLLTMAACAQSGGKTPGSVSNPVSTDARSGGEPAKSAEVILLCRVIDEDDDTLLLAAQGDETTGVYDLSLSELEITRDGAAIQSGSVDIESGALVEIHYDGTVMESYPAQLANVVRVNVLTDGFDDLCELYLEVLGDLWEVDGGLNENVKQLGVDLSQTRLLPAERAAVAVAFGREHGIMPLEGTWQELVDQGYISAAPLGGDAPADAKFYEWKDGILFSITEKEGEKLEFTAQKWRTSLGAYGFSDCKAQQDATGRWSDYTIEGQFVS